MPVKIILASGSPRRKELLKSLGIEFEIIKPNADEKILNDESPENLCKRLAELKANSINISNKIILAADTIVVIENEILGKPKNRDDAFRMLNLLQGREHKVLTGIALRENNKLISDVEISCVKFRELNQAQIKAYISSGECDDKAGAYAVQGLGSLLIEYIKGDYYNVVGLPLCKFGKMLSNFNITLENLLNA